MHFRSLITTSALVLVPFLGAACSSTSQGSTKAEPLPASMRSEEAMMEKWMAYATPGAEHKKLDERVGKWNLKVRSWHTPDAPVQESTATSEVKWILDGHYLAEEVKGQMQMGEGQTVSFQGRGTMGYDNAKKEYFSTWMDNMGTGLFVSHGNFDSSGKTMTFDGEMVCPMRGHEIPMRTVETRMGPDQWKMEMYGPDADGKEFKAMEIVYTRAK